MVTDAVGMGQQDRAERDKFENELKRILKASDEGRGDPACHRLTGFSNALPQVRISAAGHGARLYRHRFRGLRQADHRHPRICSRSSATRTTRKSSSSPAASGRSSTAADIGLHVDIFYEKLDFCHVIRWDGRLEVDSPSIPLAELLLEKMQIVEINEKDVIDTIMLLLEHPLGDIDKETINIARVAQLCASGLGLVAHDHDEPQQGADAGARLRAAHARAQGTRGAAGARRR